MKTKTEAAKVLLEAGWNWDEVREVLEKDDYAYIIFQRPFNVPGDSGTAVIYGAWTYTDSNVTNI